MKRIDIEEISPLCKSIFDYNFELHKIVDTDPFWEAQMNIGVPILDEYMGDVNDDNFYIKQL